VSLSIRWLAEVVARRLVRQAIADYIGPDDEFDEEANGDPDSTLGEEAECVFDDTPDEPEPLFAEDDGYDDAEGDAEEEDDDTEDC